MRQYLDLLRHVIDNGHDRSDRTGTGTRSVFGYQMRFDLSEGFPVTASRSGTNGPTRMAISARSTASNGARGRAATTASRSTRSGTFSTSCRRILIRGG
jgi:hypothetical protein